MASQQSGNRALALRWVSRSLGTEAEKRRASALRHMTLLSHGRGSQVGVQGLERSLVTIRQGGEMDEGGAARRITA